MMLHLNQGRAQSACGLQCRGARAARLTLLTSPIAEIAVSSPLCGSDATAIGAKTVAVLPNRIGNAQQVANAKADAMPPVTSATAPADLTPSFIRLLRRVCIDETILRHAIAGYPGFWAVRRPISLTR